MVEPSRPAPEQPEPQNPSRLKNPGGTPGGAGEFLIGLAMLLVGGYLFLDNIVVSGGGHGAWFGWRGSSGYLLIPVFVGVVMLFFNGRNLVAWLLAVGGLLAIIAGVIAKMNIYFRPATLLETLFMIVLMAGGIGLIAKSIRAH